MTALLFLLALLLPLPAMAQIEVQFTEGSPADVFTMTNTGCELGKTNVVLDLSGSAGGLFFDTEPGGDGVDVFQPFETTSGKVASV